LQLHVHRLFWLHGGRTLTGLVSRIARRLLALTAAILHNWQLGTPGRRLTAYDH
jgi:hypothetical protein